MICLIIHLGRKSYGTSLFVLMLVLTLESNDMIQWKKSETVEIKQNNLLFHFVNILLALFDVSVFTYIVLSAWYLYLVLPFVLWIYEKCACYGKWIHISHFGWFYYILSLSHSSSVCFVILLCSRVRDICVLYSRSAQNCQSLTTSK